MSALYLVPGLACLFVGGIFLLVYRSSRIRQDTLEQQFTARAWAKLADTESGTEYNYENRPRTVYYGIYEFDTVDGQHIFSASEFTYHDPKDIPGTQGNMVKIRYDPQKPTDFSLPEEEAIAKDVWPAFRKIGIGMIILGVVLTAAAAAAILGFFGPFAAELLRQA